MENETNEKGVKSYPDSMEHAIQHYSDAVFKWGYYMGYEDGKNRKEYHDEMPKV